MIVPIHKDKKLLKFFLEVNFAEHTSCITAIFGILAFLLSYAHLKRDVTLRKDLFRKWTAESHFEYHILYSVLNY